MAEPRRKRRWLRLTVLGTLAVVAVLLPCRVVGVGDGERLEFCAGVHGIEVVPEAIERTSVAADVMHHDDDHCLRR